MTDDPAADREIALALAARMGLGRVIETDPEALVRAYARAAKVREAISLVPGPGHEPWPPMRTPRDE